MKGGMKMVDSLEDLVKQEIEKQLKAEAQLIASKRVAEMLKQPEEKESNGLGCFTVGLIVFLLWAALI
jgi:hypothetical protein